MKSQTSMIARNIRLNEWAQMIQECNSRPQDMTVGEWCAQHNITKCDYYYRMKAVRKACVESVPEEVVQQAVVPVSMELLNPITEDSLVIPSSDVIELESHGVTVKVSLQTSEQLLQKVLGVLAHVK